MTTSSIAIGLAVFITSWTSIHTHFINIEPNGTIYAATGKKLNISCYSDGTYNTLEWFDGNGSIIIKNESYRVHSLVLEKGYHIMLVFNPLTAMDSSMYKCCAIFNSSLNCKKDAEIMINVTDGRPPSFKTEFASYEVIEGDDVYLECHADGYPTPKYMWLDSHGRSMHNNVGNWNASTEGWLRFYSINSSQEGTYTCVATNTHGNASKLHLLNVSRGRPPSFKIEFVSYDVMEGDDVVLECHADGYPFPKYTWLDSHGRSMHNNVGNWNVSTEGWLRIYSINSSQDGTYTCVATNMHGNASKLYMLNVSPSRDRPPTFHQNIEYYQFEVADNVILKCHAEGYPTPQYKWYNPDGQNMGYISGNWKASTRGLLEIYSIKQWQEGAYKCVAWNIHGYANKTYEIKVQYKNTLNVTVRELWQTLVRFEIQFGDSTKFKFVFAKYQLLNSSNSGLAVVTWKIGEDYIVTGLQPGMTYNFEFGVASNNKYDDVTWIENSSLTFTLPAFSPLLIVNKVKEDTIQIEFPYQSFEELEGSLKALYFVLRYVKLRQKSGSFYEDNCPITIQIPSCFGRSYVIGGLSSNSYYKVELLAMLQNGPSSKSRITVHTIQS